MSAFRHLTREEINRLINQQCDSDDWNEILVADPFSSDRLKSVTFTGKVKLGTFQKNIEFTGGIRRATGIYHTNLHNCEVGNDSFILNARRIVNYKIEDEVIIENVDLLEGKGPSSFGNGLTVNVLDETGGRKVPIYNELSAHLAYILAMYRHRPQVINRIGKMIATYARAKNSEKGKIEKMTQITNSRIIRNVFFGIGSIVEGAELLEDGSINSTEAAPVLIGSGVIMKHFIISSGTEISESAILENCFVGQACHIGKHYSAENSLFFANCVGYHGEACSIFAGPYTVTHHKSTLLIAGMFSFLNAGSGSNQSNHMYKLGPLHQGVIERGSKTTSDSYLLWPFKMGPFTLVMGRHYKHSDTSDLPFSYLIESKDESILAPGVNLRSVGTIRDAQKWPQRDERKDPVLLDFINFNLLSPFTIKKMINGRDLLIKLQKYSGEKSEFYTYENVKISRKSLERGIKLYNLGIIKFLGNALIKRLEGINFQKNIEIRERLKPDTEIGTGKWIDLAGLIAPVSEVEKLLQDIEQQKIKDLSSIQSAFKQMHQNYYLYEWTWSIDMILKEYSKEFNNFWSKDVIQLIEKWKKSVVELDHLLYEDARKEFTLHAQTGFGVDGGVETRALDFEQVRGEFEKNAQVASIKDHIRKKTKLGDELIHRMEKVNY